MELEETTSAYVGGGNIRVVHNQSNLWNDWPRINMDFHGVPRNLPG
jgi:hypothetical protein